MKLDNRSKELIAVGASISGRDHTPLGVVAEALWSDIRQIAEGYATIRNELHGLRHEFRDECREMRALMRLSYSQLDQRIHTL